MSNLAHKHRLVDRDGLTVGGILLVVPTCMAVLTVIIFVIVLFSSRAVGRTTCNNWSTETGVQTKFVLLNWADTGTCLARTPDGRWVKNSQWVAFLNGGK